MSMRCMTLFFAAIFSLFLVTSVAALDSSATGNIALPSLYMVIVGMLYITTVFLHIGGKYFIESVKVFSSKEIRDRWLCRYLSNRDEFLLLTFILGLFLLHPYLYYKLHIAVPFVPISILLLGVVIAIRFTTSDHDEWSCFLEGLLLFVGMIFLLFTFVFTWDGILFELLASRYSSMLNPWLLSASLKFSYVSFGLLLVFLFASFLKCTFSNEAVRKKHHTHSTFFKTIFTIFVIILFFLLCIILFSKLTGYFLR